jgi:hypothetical protein
MVFNRSNGSNRGKLSKAGLIAGLIFALVICASFIGYGLLEGAKYERQANNHSSENAKYTRDKITQTCVGTSRIEVIRCRYNAMDAQREYEYNQRDLVAQRQSALWAYIMGAAAVIGIALSAIGVWLVWTTFRATHRSAEIAQENLNAFREAERGHCEIKLSGGFKSDTSNIIKYSAEISNTGRSMVKVVAIRYQSLTDQTPTDKFGGATFEEFVLSEGKTRDRGISVQGISNITRFPFLGGYVEYRCKFGQMHKSYFCYAVTEARQGNGLIANGHTHWVHECKRERDWPNDT